MTKKKQIETEEVRLLKNCPKGSFVKLVTKSGKVCCQVYVLDSYDFSERKYYCYKFDNICDGKLLKPSQLVQVGFTY